MKRLLVAVALVVALGSIESVSAQIYPTRPITMVMPHPSGGPADSAGRIMTERLRGSLGQPIIIENIAGANGSIGTGRVARAAGDGYTLVFERAMIEHCPGEGHLVAQPQLDDDGSARHGKGAQRRARAREDAFRARVLR
jgi:tripartite tricarboxylate transporter family receptor